MTTAVVSRWQSTLPDDKPGWVKFRVWLEAGQTPRFIFPNGPYESRAAVLQVNKRYADDFQGKFAKAGVVRTHAQVTASLEPATGLASASY